LIIIALLLFGLGALYIFFNNLFSTTLVISYTRDNLVQYGLIMVFLILAITVFLAACTFIGLALTN
jgi:hypothetical protein